MWPAVLRGYLEILPLDPAKIGALPALILRQGAIILVWLAGRTVEGDSTPDALAEYVDRALALNEWIAANGTRLVAEGLRASA